MEAGGAGGFHLDLAALCSGNSPRAFVTTIAPPGARSTLAECASIAVPAPLDFLTVKAHSELSRCHEVVL